MDNLKKLQILTHKNARFILIIVALLLAVALWAPLWCTRMVSPQYRGDDALEVRVYAGRISGDIQEIQTLNQYVGVHIPLNLPELHVAPYVFGGLLLLALIALMLPGSGRRKAAMILFVLMLATVAGGFGFLRYRLYHLGHDRGKSILARVPDFTPPILGTAQIANFTVHTTLQLGAWAFLGAIVLTGWIAFVNERREQEGEEKWGNRRMSQWESKLKA